MKYADAVKLRRYCQEITARPRPMSRQSVTYLPNKAVGYCEDWHIIELLKCLFHGGEVYLLDPPPRRLRGNPLFKPDEIVGEANELFQKCKHDVDAVIEHFREMRKGDDDA